MDTDFDRFSGDGEWLDEIDLREKFKNKPEQAQHIIDNARSVMHPTRGVLVWEVLEFKSSSGSSTEKSVQLKRVASQEQLVKPPKAAKVLKITTCEGKAEEKAIEMELEPAQKARLEKVLALVEKALATGEKTQASANVEEVKADIPTKVGCFMVILRTSSISLFPNQGLLL